MNHKNIFLFFLFSQISILNYCCSTEAQTDNARPKASSKRFEGYRILHDRKKHYFAFEHSATLPKSGSQRFSGYHVLKNRKESYFSSESSKKTE